MYIVICIGYLVNLTLAIMLFVACIDTLLTSIFLDQEHPVICTVEEWNWYSKILRAKLWFMAQWQMSSQLWVEQIKYCILCSSFSHYYLIHVVRNRLYLIIWSLTGLSILNVCFYNIFHFGFSYKPPQIKRWDFVYPHQFEYWLNPKALSFLVVWCATTVKLLLPSVLIIKGLNVLLKASYSDWRDE